MSDLIGRLSVNGGIQHFKTRRQRMHHITIRNALILAVASFAALFIPLWSWGW